MFLSHHPHCPISCVCPSSFSIFDPTGGKGEGWRFLSKTEQKNPNVSCLEIRWFPCCVTYSQSYFNSFIILWQMAFSFCANWTPVSVSVCPSVCVCLISFWCPFSLMVLVMCYWANEWWTLWTRSVLTLCVWNDIQPDCHNSRPDTISVSHFRFRLEWDSRFEKNSSMGN